MKNKGSHSNIIANESRSASEIFQMSQFKAFGNKYRVTSKYDSLESATPAIYFTLADHYKIS